MVIAGSVVAIVGAGLYILFKRLGAGEVDVGDVVASVVCGIGAVLMVGAVIFLFNLACAPFRIERDRADAADAALRDLQNRTHTEIPNAHLAALQRYENSLTERDEQDQGIARLVHHYFAMRDGVVSFARHSGQLDPNAIVRIAELIFSQLARIVPPNQAPPGQELRIEQGWNHYLVIYPVEMSVPPKVTITGLPAGSHAEVTNTTRISFEVRFWPQHPRIGVAEFHLEASADI